MDTKFIYTEEKAIKQSHFKLLRYSVNMSHNIPIHKYSDRQ